MKEERVSPCRSTSEGEFTYHDGDVVPVVVRKRSVAAQHVLLRLEKGLQILRVVAHHLDHVLQPVVVQKRVHKKTMRLQAESRRI